MSDLDTVSQSRSIGVASIAAQLQAAEQALQNERIMTTYASFKAKEAADAAAATVSKSDIDYDERFRFRFSSPTTESSKNMSSGGNLIAGGSVNVTVNVAGSVTAENDLVQTVRNGLLAAQYNGNQINLQAI